MAFLALLTATETTDAWMDTIGEYQYGTTYALVGVLAESSPLSRCVVGAVVVRDG